MPGLGFAELGPGDLGLSLGYTALQRRPYPPAMEEARARVFAACKWNKLAFLEGATPDKICASLDEGVRVISGHNPRLGQGRPGAPDADDAGLVNVLAALLLSVLASPPPDAPPPARCAPT